MRALASILFVLCAATAFGASKHVRQAASGTGSGDTWTDAYTEIPATLTRGNTYYVADGTYGSGGTTLFDDAVSGTTYITIKYATPAEHGSATGWSDSYSATNAMWVAGWGILTSYLEFDGVRGGGPTNWQGNFGFKISTPQTQCIASSYGITNSFVSFAHVEATLNASNGPPYETLMYYPSTYATDIAVRYCYFHDNPGDQIVTVNLQNFTVEYSKLARNFQDATRHGDVNENDGASTNHVWRYNFIEDGVGTYLLGHHNTLSRDGFYIYGNIFYFSSTYTGQTDNGSIATLSSGTGTVTNLFIINNTFYGYNNAGTFAVVLNIAGSKGVATNNIWYFDSSAVSPFGFTRVDHDYNAFRYEKSGSEVTEAGKISLSSNPFTSASTRDLRLSASVAGVAVASPYNVDMLGVTRGTDGTNDVGALEFSPSTTYRGFSFGPGVQLIGPGRLTQ